jgi:uncharacterized RDD family membrane protein YckC
MAQPNFQGSNAPQNHLRSIDLKMTSLKHPWRRHFARHVDTLIMLLLSLPALFTIEFVTASILGFASHDPAATLLGQLLSVLALCLCFILCETVLLATWGTTPGKRLFGLIVRTPAGEKLNWKKSLLRAVYANGLLTFWSLVPLTAIILLTYQKSRLKRTGFTTWDQADETLVYRI